jgi:3-dehydroquinate dehydratase-2
VKILVVQGANMAYLGKRQPEIYGTTTAAEFDAILLRHASARGYALEIFYTHIEGEAIERIYQALDSSIDGLVINPAGFLHAKPPVVEVHMSDIDKRGLHSVTAEAARGIVAGFGIRSYLMGLNAVADLIADERSAAAKK